MTHEVPAVERTIRLMHLIAERGSQQTSASLARELGINQSTCYRLLKTLEGADWIREAHGGGYELGTGLLGMLRPLDRIRQAALIAQPILDGLAEETGLTARLSTKTGAMQVTIATAQPKLPISVLTPVGVPYPVVQAASGAALLAGLEAATVEALIAQAKPAEWAHHTPEQLRNRIAECRENGVIENIGNHPQGLGALACPVNGCTQPLALSLIGLPGQISETTKGKYRKQLVAARKRIEQQLH